MEEALNIEQVRRDRLRKLQREMAAREIGALLLTNPVNIRYATGTTCMTLWTSVNLARYALVPAQGDPIVFEYSKALFLAQAIWSGSRPAKTWQFRFAGSQATARAREWAAEIKSLLREQAATGGLLAVDTLDFFGFEALKEAGLKLADSDGPLEAAKLVKTTGEIALLRESCRIGEAALGAVEHAIRPGITENELYGVFWNRLLALGAEYCSTRLLSSGEKTNPWFQEAGTRRVEAGDLVGIDTDMTGPEGYLCDISRTFLCGTEANREQKEAYRVAYDFVQAMVERCRVGTSFEELVRGAPRYPKEYERRSYSCMIHGSGFDDEPPFLPYPHEPHPNIPEGELAPNMVLSVEFYAGKEGAREGVKLEEQILVTSEGPVLLAHYPFAEHLL